MSNYVRKADDDAAEHGWADPILDSAEELGYQAGRGAGSWVTDGNSTTDSYRRLLTGIEDGDPAVLDLLPVAPLSGEWDGPTPASLAYDLGIDTTLEGTEVLLEEACERYEVGFDRGVQDEITETCNNQLQEGR